MLVELVNDPVLIERWGYPKDQARTMGPGIVHQSDIIKALMRRLDPKKYAAEFEMNARIEGGILFETILEEALSMKYATVRPGEIVSPEGILMSPDGVNPTLMAGEEFKATWKSCRHGIVDDDGMPLFKFLPWFIQMKGYAKWLETLFFILRVFFVNGNYNRSGTLKDGRPDPDSGPLFRTYHIHFTEEEVDENWQMILNVGREVGLLSA